MQFTPPEKEKPQIPEKPSIPEKEGEVWREIEKVPAPEIEKVGERAVKKVKPRAIKVKPKPEPKSVLEKSETYKKIDSILFGGLDETYQSLPENLKKEFKKKQAETATQIEKIISQAKIAVHKIINLIKGWLQMIPGVNKFFLEQETKIKTGKILELAKKKKN